MRTLSALRSGYSSVELNMRESVLRETKSSFVVVVIYMTRLGLLLLE